MKSLSAVIVVIALAAAFAGCAVTSGSTFASVAAAVASGSEGDARADESVPDDTDAPLRVVTRPDDAEVYIDGRRRGSTPLDLEEIEPGTHLLVIAKDGYYEVRRRIEVPVRGSLVIEVELERITGFLDVTVWPRDADVSVAGTRVNDGFEELAVGSYTVRAELFGYRSVEERMRIREQQVTRVEIDLEPAPFEVDGLSAWRRRFNPANPGLVGSTMVSYRVTAPGTGTLEIRDDAGTIVRSVPQGPYATWGQEYRWDGTDESGRVVPDGTYEVMLRATGNDGHYETSTTTVEVDGSLVVRYRSIWTATPGLIYAPTLDALPAGQVQLSMQLAGIVAPFEGTFVSRFPGRAGIRVGLGTGLELFGYGGTVLHSAPLDDSYSIGGALAWDAFSLGSRASGVGVGLAAGGMYRTPGADGRIASPDTQASYPVVFVSVPVTVRHGSLAGLFAAEYRRTVDRIVYGEEPLPEGENEPGSIAYFRTGIVADLERVTIGASGAIRTVRFEEGFALDLPFQAGVEAHWIIPRSSVVVSGFLASEIESSNDFYIMSGLGVGVLF